MMSTSISLSNKSNIVTDRNSTTNGDNDRNSSVNSGKDNDGINERYNAWITRIQDKLGKVVNHKTKLISINLHVKISTSGLKLGAATCFEFT